MFILFPGFPEALEEDDLSEEVSAARALTRGDAARPAAPRAVEESGLRSTHLSDADIETLRGRFPILAELSTGFIRGLSATELLSLERASFKQRESEKFKDAEEKLASNRVNLGLHCTEIKAGQDDRWSRLHDARFLAGAGCSATKLWLTAREQIGLNGHPPISTYDMQAVGLAGFVMARGWCEIANPSSPKISVRMFNINNCAARASSSRTKQDDDELVDFAEVGEFVVALRAMRSAMAFVMPWNMSIAALEGFLINTRFCKDELSGLERQASILTSFTDYVLSKNANRWRNIEPFISHGELRAVWNSFFSARPQSVLAKKNQASKQWKSRPFKKAFLDVCFAWNRGQCSKPAGTCFSKMGTPLRHVCDFKDDPTDPLKVCGEAHQRVTAHK
jgi:hypothetical protein